MFVGVFWTRSVHLGETSRFPPLGLLSPFSSSGSPSASFLIKDSASITFLPSTLFTIHARLIDQSLEAKLARMPDADPERAKLQTLVALLDSELHKAQDLPTAWEKLGFDPDYLYYHSPLIPAIYRYAGNDRQEIQGILPVLL